MLAGAPSHHLKEEKLWQILFPLASRWHSGCRENSDLNFWRTLSQGQVDMEWIDWILSREFRQYLLDQDLFFPLLFAGRLVGVTLLESLVPARKVMYRSMLWQDVLGAMTLVYITVPLADYASKFIVIRPSLPQAVLTLPTVVTFILYYLVGHFGAY